MSNRAIHSFNYSVHEFMKHYKKVGSYEHYIGRMKRLELMGRTLNTLGYAVSNVTKLKQKHVDILVKHWKANDLSVGRIKNLLSDVRFVCAEKGRKGVVKSNDDYAIGSRSSLAKINKAITGTDFTGVNDHHLRHSLELQRVFGLRREECLKTIPSLADKGAQLYLKGSWTKGGIERYIPIRTMEQRMWLEKAKALVGERASLIPQGKTYIQQRGVYQRETRKQGYKRLHGLRHAYAQSRYKELTGWDAPINGGKDSNKLTKVEVLIDRKARLVVSRELGHSRMAITKIYCG